MSTLYTRDGQDTFELPGRTVNTFASGLVRIDSSYLAKTSNIQNVRNVSFQVGQSIYGDDTYPAVDGLYLYPEAQEIRKEYGMTELIASFYGRTRTDVPPPTVTEQILYINSQYSFGGVIAELPVQVSVNNLFFEFVVPVNEVASFRDNYSFDTPLTEPNFMSYDIGAGAVQVPFTKSGSFSNSNYDYYSIVTLNGAQTVIIGTPKILVIGQKNYGNFVELQITYNR